MRKDIDIPEVANVFIAALPETNDKGEESWYVYLINDLPVMMEGVMITSKGYEDFEKPTQLKTSVMRHPIGHVPYKTAVKVELISPEVFEIFNEYWVTFFQEGKLMEKKFIFGPHTIDKDFLESLPLLKQKGILVK